MAFVARRSHASKIADLEREQERLRSAAVRARERAALQAGVGAALLDGRGQLSAVQRVAELLVPGFADVCAFDLAGVAGAAPARAAFASAGPKHVARPAEPRNPAIADGGRELTAPLIASGRAIGAMVLRRDQGRAFDADDLEWAERLALEVALAIDAARAVTAERHDREALERAASSLARLQAITADLARAMTIGEIADTIIDHGLATLHTSTGALWTIEGGATHAKLFRAAGQVDLLREYSAEIPLDGDSPLADAVRKRQPVFLPSGAELEQRYPASAARFRNAGFEPPAGCCLPLLVGGEVLGALAFGFLEVELTKDLQTFLVLVADQCAQAFDRARLLDCERRARAEADLLYDLVSTIARAERSEEVYSAALDAVTRALGVDRAALLAFDDSGVMRFKAWRGLSEAFRAAVEGPSPWARDADRPQPFVVADTATDPFAAQFRPVLMAESVRAIVFVPLVRHRRLLGKFVVYSSTPRAFTPCEIRLAVNIAGHVAAAVARKLGEAEIARLLAEARAARESAEAASRAKDEFLAVVSHELRTPLSSIVGWSSILQSERGHDPDVLTRGLRVIERNAKAQARIIEDLLDMSRIISGRLVIDTRAMSLSGVVGDVLEVMRASAAAKQIELAFEPAGEPFMIVGDPERVRQIVVNLLSNAIKFTQPRGHVDVALSRSQGAVSLAVKDTGPGITPEFMPRLFERFQQGDSSTTRRHGGLGLGLAIVRHLVELHGGRVRAESGGPGKGSTFTATFPVGAIVPAPKGAPPIPARRLGEPRAGFDLRGARVLVVEDEEDARALLEQILAGCGASVETARDAREAIDVVTRFQPDVVVCDVGLPGEDGYALIRRVRALDAPVRDVPAVALTAYARPEDTKRALAAGFQQHVAKPAPPDDLLRAVATVRRVARAQRTV
jgi:signal transduction histidine kinase/ActR/RegA family two-component response regulator